MGKIRGLVIHNLKKDKGQYVSFGIIILLTAFILNLALVLSFQMDRAYERKSNDLNTAELYFCIPKVQNTDVLKRELLDLKGVKRVESREGIFTSAVMKEFRGVDFAMNTIFYNMDEIHHLNRYELVKESNKSFEASVFIPLFVAEFGEYGLEDEIVYEVDGTEYAFHVAGILEEMQYGNAGSGLLCAYLPEDAYQTFAGEKEGNQVIEYSLMTNGDVNETKSQINEMLSNKWIHLVSMLDSTSTKQTRTMVCDLTVLILMAFSFVVLLVSMFLCKFRIQNSIEEEITQMGVLKAMGYTGTMILMAVIFPYMIVGVLSALAGILLSYGLLPGLAQMLALQSGFSFQPGFDTGALIVTFLGLMGMTLLFTYFSAERIKKLVPINAIRGNSGGKRSRKNYFPLDQTVGSLHVNLILKQIAVSAKQNVLLFLVSFLMMVLAAFAGTLFYNVVIEPGHFTSTLSEEMPSVIMTVKPDRFEKIKKEMTDSPQAEQVLEYASAKVEAKEKTVTAFITPDFSLVSNDLCYEGRNPEKENEIAVGSGLAQDYSIGDKIKVQKGNSVYTYDIVGYIQSVNYQGEVLELTNEGYLNLDSTHQSQSLYLYLNEKADVKSFVEEIEKKYKWDMNSVVNYDKMTKSSQGIYLDMVEGTIAAIFLITILITFLVLYMMIESLIIKRKQELGIYKAIGYSNIQLILQIAGSFLSVSAAAILISAVAGLWYMPVINGMLFQMIGAMKNNLEVSFTFLLLFAISQIAINFVISVCLALPIRRISAYSLIRE